MSVRVIAQDALRATLSALDTVEWNWTADEAPSLAQRLGWKLVEVIDDDGIVVTPEWGLTRDEVNIPYSNGKVDRIIMRITDVAPDPDAETAKVLQDTFVDAVAVGKEVLGPPDKNVPGPEPEVRWRRTQSTIAISNTRLAINIAWARNEFQDMLDELED
ncbi:DUF6301 family protein [Krasilnikovia sp. MM14-A1259]|uniref:DUF6301 family protein n=1 Tax=Krasilnikovia sp. MM14-A1259 TaxID=3373539 RepID=UPI00382827CE